VTAASFENVVAGLDISPPERIVVGKGNAFVIGGYCYHRTERTRGLDVEVAGMRQPAAVFGLPRADVYDRLPGGDAARSRAFRSGFVAMPTLLPGSTPTEADVELILKLPGGREGWASVGQVKLQPALEPPTDPRSLPFSAGDEPRVAICMATYNPPAELLRRQIDSLRRQTHSNWACVISDDASEPEQLGRLLAEIEGDGRFLLDRSERRLGFYANFERALSMAPPSADYVTLCDQDDRWYPDKLARLIDGIGDAELAYSDARVVDPSGELVHPSYWTVRRNNHTNFASLLLANSITGAASLFRRDLLDDALPFPPDLFKPFHDHWLAVVALARGSINYIDEPLYDYVQHSGAVIGHSTANRKPRPIHRHLRERLRNPGPGSRIVYYYNWFQQLLFAEVIRLRCWPRMDPSKRRVLQRLLRADRGVIGLAWLLGRRMRRLWGHDETLDRELFYSYALARRRAVSLWTLGSRKPRRLLPRDASIPPAPGAKGGS
jgi:glycosyltransferase involved in cell wall biosynthesis